MSIINSIKKENEQLKEKINSLETHIKNLENYSRRNNIVTYGVPIAQNRKTTGSDYEIGGCDRDKIKTK